MGSYTDIDDELIDGIIDTEFEQLINGLYSDPLFIGINGKTKKVVWVFYRFGFKKGLQISSFVDTDKIQLKE